MFKRSHVKTMKEVVICTIQLPKTYVINCIQIIIDQPLIFLGKMQGRYLQVICTDNIYRLSCVFHR